MTYREQILGVLEGRRTRVLSNPTRAKMIADAVDHREAFRMATGTLATWTAPESTGRSPKDTYIVRRPGSEGAVDWTSPNCLPLEPSTFEMILADALEELGRKDRLYEIDRVVGADSSWALPVKGITCNALGALFLENMFRPVPPDVGRSIFASRPFTLLSLPYSRLDPVRYDGRLRKLPDGRTSGLAVVMDFDHSIGIVFGSSYMGSMKKLIFTVMNYYLPEAGILPLHCSANEGPAGDTALLLGLSGTGKTTLSADPERALIGDDEHGWNDSGIANFEYGMYAKLINLNPAKEPEIYRATFHPAHYLEQGSIVENLMVYPDGSFDLDDGRYTENSRASFRLGELSNVKAAAVGGHPSTILFLTADADGVIPPISRLTPGQAMFWFMMGYTSKLAGTETGVTEPQATFSRFFGAPFMPRQPGDYTGLLGRKMKAARGGDLPGQHRLERRGVRDGQADRHHPHPGHGARRAQRDPQGYGLHPGPGLQGPGAARRPGGAGGDAAAGQHLEGQGRLRLRRAPAGLQVQRRLREVVRRQGGAGGGRGVPRLHGAVRRGGDGALLLDPPLVRRDLPGRPRHGPLPGRPRGTRRGRPRCGLRHRRARAGAGPAGPPRHRARPG